MSTILQQFVALSTRHPWPVLLVGLALAVAGGLAVSTIRVDSQLEALLPPETVAPVREAQRRYAGDAPMYLIVESSDPAQNRRLAAELLVKARGWDEARWAIDRRDPAFFSDRRLLYIEANTLAETADRVEERFEWEQCERSPLCESLDAKPPDPQFESLRDELESLPEVRTLSALLGTEGLASLDRDPGVPPAAKGDGRPGELCRPDGQLCLVYVILRGDPADLEYASRVVDEAQALLDSVRPERPSGSLDLRVDGRYQRLEANRSAVANDLTRTAALSITLVLLVLLLQFKGPRAFVLLLAPLAVGAGWTALVVALVAPPLNIISAATLVILAGIGVDFGVHLVTHYGFLRSRGRDPTEAVEATVRSLAMPLLLAACTTCAGFGALASGRFEGFAQMGALCALGIALTFLAYVALFPALTLVGHRLLPERRSLTRSLPAVVKLGRPSRGMATAIVACGLAVGVAGGAILPTLEFEHDLGKLMPEPSPGVSRRLDYGPALRGTARSPTLMLADDPVALEAAADGLRALYPEGLLQDSPWLITPQTFVPADQQARLAEIARLRSAIDRVETYASDETRREIQRWRPYLAIAEPITANELPRWVRETFSERDGTFGTVGVLYQGGSSYDAREMEHRARRMREWEARFEGVRFASQASLLGEVVAKLKEDAPIVVGLAALALFLGTLLIGRSPVRTLLVAAPVLLSVLATFAVMGVCDIRANLYNLIVFPLAFGIGVDGAVYVTFRVYRGGRSVLRWAELPVVGRAVVGSTVTTAVAFLSLVQSQSGGLASLGTLASIALTATLAMNLLWLPALLRLLEGNRPVEPPG